MYVHSSALLVSERGYIHCTLLSLVYLCTIGLV